METLKYLTQYSLKLQEQIQQMIEAEKLSNYLLEKYPNTHSIKTDKALYNYVNDLKNETMKKAQPISRVIYDNKIHVINNALGTHTFVSRVQGGKLKAKNEIRIGNLFKTTPEPFLKMIVVHELAHLKEKEHNKAFYNLCTHMEPSYHQLEFDLRVYLTHLHVVGKLYLP